MHEKCKRSKECEDYRQQQNRENKQSDHQNTLQNLRNQIHTKPPNVLNYYIIITNFLYFFKHKKEEPSLSSSNLYNKGNFFVQNFYGVNNKQLIGIHFLSLKSNA